MFHKFRAFFGFSISIGLPAVPLPKVDFTDNRIKVGDDAFFAFL